jgi:hypothetical protein
MVSRRATKTRRRRAVDAFKAVLLAVFQERPDVLARLAAIEPGCIDADPFFWSAAGPTCTETAGHERCAAYFAELTSAAVEMAAPTMDAVHLLAWVAATYRLAAPDIDPTDTAWVDRTMDVRAGPDGEVWMRVRFRPGATLKQVREAITEDVFAAAVDQAGWGRTGRRTGVVELPALTLWVIAQRGVGGGGPTWPDIGRRLDAMLDAWEAGAPRPTGLEGALFDEWQRRRDLGGKRELGGSFSPEDRLRALYVRRTVAAGQTDPAGARLSLLPAPSAPSAEAGRHTAPPGVAR